MSKGSPILTPATLNPASLTSAVGGAFLAGTTLKQEILSDEEEDELSDMEEELLLREQHRLAREHYRREVNR